jgi:transposase
LQPSTIGLDVAKQVFQVHGVDAAGQVVVRKKLRRSELLAFFKAPPPCLIGLEAGGTAHHWARELTGLAHTVRLMPAIYVKRYIKRGKNDAMSILMLHRTRELLVRQRTMLVNSLRGHLAEFGLVVPQGIWRLPELRALASRASGKLGTINVYSARSMAKARFWKFSFSRSATRLRPCDCYANSFAAMALSRRLSPIN